MASGEELSAKLAYGELEDFLRSAAEMAYPRRTNREQCKLLLIHIRNPCYLRYNLLLETDDRNHDMRNNGKLIGRENDEENCLARYKNKLALRKNANQVQMLKGSSSSRFHLESSQESSPANFKEVLSARGNSGFPSFRSSNSNAEDKDIARQVESGLRRFNGKISAVFERRSVVSGVKRICRFREDFVHKQAKVKLAFNVWRKLIKLGDWI